ncbi:hypothetical protein [Streptomyces sp. NPDC001450]
MPALAKCTSLLLVAALVAVYTTVWMHMFWRPERLLVLTAGMFTGALTYGGTGIVLAAVLRSEPYPHSPLGTAQGMPTGIEQAARLP